MLLTDLVEVSHNDDVRVTERLVEVAAPLAGASWVTSRDPTSPLDRMNVLLALNHVHRLAALDSLDHRREAIGDPADAS
jgi:hypothetical protein